MFNKEEEEEQKQERALSTLLETLRRWALAGRQALLIARRAPDLDLKPRLATC